MLRANFYICKVSHRSPNSVAEHWGYCHQNIAHEYPICQYLCWPQNIEHVRVHFRILCCAEWPAAGCRSAGRVKIHEHGFRVLEDLWQSSQNNSNNKMKIAICTHFGWNFSDYKHYRWAVGMLANVSQKLHF